MYLNMYEFGNLVYAINKTLKSLISTANGPKFIYSIFAVWKLPILKWVHDDTALRNFPKYLYEILGIYVSHKYISSSMRF